MRQRSIRDYLLLSWLAPLGLAVVGSAALSASLSYIDYSGHRQALERQLRQNANVIARRMAAEIFLRENGRPEAVLEALKADFNLSSIGLVTSEKKIANDRRGVHILEPVPGVSPQQFIQVSVDSRSFQTFINFKHFLFGLVPIFGLVLSGFLFQRTLVRRYLIQPIQLLARTSVGVSEPHLDWPTELQTIARELAESFSHREQAVFGHLARGIIHDLRTYLNSIHTAIQLLEAAPEGSEKRKSLLEKLAIACSRNIQKIQEVLNLSLDSSREVVVNPKETDLGSTVQQSIGNIASIADSKGVIISTSILNSIFLNHDRIQLERVFTNLIKNAIEASESSPENHRNVTITLAKSDSPTVVIAVEDSGPGIQDPESLFRPLKTTKRHGYGLGLFVSKKIVEAHRGQILTGRSERLGGASFSVVLPKNEVDA